MALEAAFQAIPSRVSAGEMDSLLRAYVAEFPGPVLRAINVRLELLGRAGSQVIGPLGVLSRMIFPAAARASNTARVKWFESIYWSRTSRLSLAFRLAPPTVKVADEKSPEGLEAAVSESAFEQAAWSSGAAGWPASRMGR